jgi:hypothetical protein
MATVVKVASVHKNKNKEAWRGMEIRIHAFLTSALNGCEFHAPATLIRQRYNRMLGVPQSRSEDGGEENISSLT